MIGDGGAGKNDDDSEKSFEDGVACGRVKSKSFGWGDAHVFDTAAVDGKKEDNATADDVSQGCFSRLKASQEPEWDA